MSTATSAESNIIASPIKPVALITGASSGIGRALALELMQQGYLVYATARQSKDVQALCNEGLNGLLLDVTQTATIAEAVQQIQLQQGRLDLLINNAGFGAMGPVLDCSQAQLLKQFQTNVFSLIDITKQCLSLLRAAKGTVLNIGSVSADFVTPYAGVYCASKAAVHALNTALRLELAPFAIKVVLLQPGAVASSFGATASQHAEQLIREQSIWWPLREGVRRRAKASQANPTPVAKFAKTVVRQLQHKHTPHVIRAGYGSWILPLLARWLPLPLLDWALRRQFALPPAGSLAAPIADQDSNSMP